jgi:hypothetical protein
MAKFIIASQWMVTAETEVDASSLEEALDKIHEMPTHALGGEYLDDSFEINDQVTKELNNLE